MKDKSPKTLRFSKKLESMLASQMNSSTTNTKQSESHNNIPSPVTPKNSPKIPYKFQNRQNAKRIRSPRKHTTRTDDAGALMKTIVGSNNAAFYHRAIDLLDYLTQEYGDIRLFKPHTLSQIFSDTRIIGYVKDRTNSILKFSGPYQSKLSKNLFLTESPVLLYLFLKDARFLSFFMEQLNISQLNESKLMTLVNTSIIMELHEIKSKDTYRTIFRESSLAIRLTRKITETLCSNLIRNFWESQLEKFRGYDGWPQTYDNDEKNFQDLIKNLASSIQEYDFGKPLTVLMRMYFDLFNAQSQVFNLITRLSDIDHLLSQITEKKIKIKCAPKKRITKLQKANDSYKEKIKKLEVSSTAHNQTQKDIIALTSIIDVINGKIFDDEAIIEKAEKDAESQSSNHNDKYGSQIKGIKRKIEMTRKQPLIGRLKTNAKAGSQEEINQTNFSIHQLNYIFWFRIIPKIIDQMDEMTNSTTESTLCKKIIKTLQQAAVNKKDSETTALLAKSLFNSTKRMIKSKPTFTLASLTDHRQTKWPSEFLEHSMYKK